MDTTPIPGFITRKQASDRCKRAERTLQRYWSRAIEHKDEAVLKNLKLRTEDGQVIGGKDVTKANIDKLKRQGKNPTWYVHATWVERTYGPRLQRKDHNTRSASVEPLSDADGRGPEPHAQPATELVTVLKQQITDLKADKLKLEDDRRQEKQHHREDFKMLKQMFDTLKEDHEGTKQLLGKALDVGVGQLRQSEERKPSTARTPTSPQSEPAPEDDVVDVAATRTSFFELHLPTLSRPFRRK